MRDDFSVGTKELLAKRVGFTCSNPECRQATSGPQVDPNGAVNIGVAAHISAASPAGPRYDKDLTPENRADSSNGISLCQTCAKLIDNDPIRFSRAVLEGWKRAAERSAAIALTQGRNVGKASQLGQAKIERLMPALLEEMLEDLLNNPTTREFVLLKRCWAYNSRGPYLAYYLDDHDDLEGKLQVLANLGLIQEITYNSVRRFVFQEEFEMAKDGKMGSGLVLCTLVSESTLHGATAADRISWGALPCHRPGQCPARHLPE